MRGGRTARMRGGLTARMHLESSTRAPLGGCRGKGVVLLSDALPPPNTSILTRPVFPSDGSENKLRAGRTGAGRASLSLSDFSLPRSLAASLLC